MGENIQRLRKEKALSQEYVAQKIGISRQSISLWEKNKTVPSIENLVTLSEILGVTVDELLGREAAQPADNSRQPVQELPIGTVELAKDYGTKKKGINLYYRKTILVRAVIAALGLMYIMGGFLYSFLMKDVFAYVNAEHFSWFPLVTFLCIGLGLIVPLVLTLYKRRESLKLSKCNGGGIVKLYFYRQGIGFSTEREDYAGNFFAYYNEFRGLFISEKELMFIHGPIMYTMRIDDIQGDKDFIIRMLIGNIRYLYSTDVRYKYPKCRMTKKQIKFFQKLSWSFLALGIISANIFGINIQLYVDAGDNNILTWISAIAFIVFSLISLIIAIVGKAKGIKTGARIVISAVMLFYALIGLLSISVFGKYNAFEPYTIDYGYMERIEQTTGIDFPDNGEIVRNSAEKNVIYTISGMDYYMDYQLIRKNVSYVTFTDQMEIEEFEKYLAESGEWVKSTSDFPKFMRVPFDNLKGYEYFSVYNVTDNELNKNIKSPGNYSLIFLKYDVDENKLDIMEYSLNLK